MKSNLALKLAAGLCLATAACGSDDDDSGAPSAASLAGTYEVTAHTRNADGCDSEGDEVSEFTHFELRPGESFLGLASLEMFECEDAMTCEMDAASAVWFADRTAWTLETSYASGSGTSCNVGKNISKLTVTGNTVRVERREYDGSITVAAGQDCLDQDADDHLDDLDCTLEVFAGEKL